MFIKNELWVIWDSLKSEIVFTYRTGAGNEKKALFNNRRFTEKAINFLCMWDKSRKPEDFEPMKITRIGE